MMASHQPKVSGSKARGFTASCPDCDYIHLGTYVLNRAQMEREVQAHPLLVRRGQLFRDLDAGTITVEEWREGMASLERELEKVR